MDVPPLINIGGTCPPCPIGIDAPGLEVSIGLRLRLGLGLYAGLSGTQAAR